jgi:hypothetical protein
MKLLKLIIGLSLIAVLLISGACASSENEASPSPEPEESAVGEESPAAIDKGVLLFSVEGADEHCDIYESEYRYWVNQVLTYDGIDPAGEIDWDGAAPDASYATLKEYVKHEAIKSANVFRAILIKSEEMGLELSAENQEYLDGIRDEYITYFGDEATYLEQLSYAGLTEEMLSFQEEVSMYYTMLSAAVFGENGEEISDEDAISAAESQGVIRAKHILFNFPEALDGGEITEEQRQETLDKADALYKELAAISDPNTLLTTFDAKMQELSDDPGKVSNPDGYQFTEGVMVESFTVTTQNTPVNTISEPVDIEYGYSIILRLPIDTGIEVSSPYGGGTPRQMAVSSKMDELISAWTDELTIISTETFDSLDYAALIAS